MSSVVLKLGSRLFGFEGPCVERFLTSYAGSAPFIVKEGEASLKVVCGGATPSDYTPADDTLLYDFMFEEIGSRCLFFCLGDEYRFRMLSPDGKGALIEMCYRRGADTVETSCCDNPSVLRFALWFAVSMLSAPVHQTFVHSSVIVYRGRAVLFLGESGTGKSTHTSLWLNNIEGSRLLNDDSPILAIEDGVPMIYGSPWSGKRPVYVPRSFPLAAAVRLSQASSNTIRRLRFPEDFAALQPSLPPALMQDTFFTDSLVDILSTTLERVPLFHLQCLPDAFAARMSCDAVFNQVSSNTPVR